MKFNSGTVQGYNNFSIPYNLIQKKTEKLAIIFPGLGYTVEKPLLYYSTCLFLQHDYDVLQINYHYTDSAYKSFSGEKLSEAIRFDARAVIDKILEENSYEDFTLLGKSLGTIQ